MDIIKGKVLSDSKPADEDGKRITFVLHREDNSEPMSCISSVDFFGAHPTKDQNVILRGEQKANLILGRTPYFVFSTLES